MLRVYKNCFEKETYIFLVRILREKEQILFFEGGNGNAVSRKVN